MFPRAPGLATGTRSKSLPGSGPELQASSFAHLAHSIRAAKRESESTDTVDRANGGRKPHHCLRGSVRKAPGVDSSPVRALSRFEQNLRLEASACRCS